MIAVVEFLNGEQQRAIFSGRVLDTVGVDLVLMPVRQVRSDVNVLRPKVVSGN